MSISKDLTEYAKSISEDLEHGASQILKVAAGSLHTAILKNPKVEQAELKAAAKDYAMRIIHGQRQMAGVLNFSNTLLLTIESSKEGADLSKELKEVSLNISKGSAEALSKIAAHAAGIIKGSKFMAHSRSSTLFNFFNAIKKREGLMVFVTQSRPGGEGRLLAGELSVAGIRSLLIEESEAMMYLPGTQALLVGADAILPSGVVNKVGTRMIAMAARELGVPVFCLAERMKIWPFDEPVLSNLEARTTKMKAGDTIFELVPGSLFNQIILETGATTLEGIALERKDIQIAPEIRKLVGV